MNAANIQNKIEQKLKQILAENEWAFLELGKKLIDLELTVKNLFYDEQFIQLNELLSKSDLFQHEKVFQLKSQCENFNELLNYYIERIIKVFDPLKRIQSLYL